VITSQNVDAQHRRALLAAARDAVAAHLARTPVRAGPLESDPELQKPSGVFVSLHHGSELRGCIGTLEASSPLIDTIRTMAVSAATRDPRFPPVSSEELAELTFEISVLGEPRAVRADDIEVGRHGLCVRRDHFRGVLLPQVATEHDWTPREFVEHTCRKAGLPAGAWEDPRTALEAFEAEVFSDQ
jgi:uncharacterized protein